MAQNITKRPLIDAALMGGAANGLQQAIQAIKYGARPPIVMDLVRFLKVDEVKHLYLQINKKPAPKGKLPEVTSYYTKSNLVRTHSTILLNIHKTLKQAGVKFPDTYIKTYEFYLSLVGEDNAKLNFDRAWYLLRMMGIAPDLFELTCPKCNTIFVAHASDPTGDPTAICPYERIMQVQIARQDNAII